MHGNDDQVNSEIHFEAVNERFLRCTWRRESSEFGDILGGHDRANMEAVIERVWRLT